MENVDWRHLTTGSSGLTGQARSQLNRKLDGSGCAGLQCVACPGTLAVIMLSPHRIHRSILNSVGGKSQSHDCVGVGSFSLMLVHASILLLSKISSNTATGTSHVVNYCGS